MEKIQTIKEACDGVAGAMERLQYSPLTIKYFRQDCRRFRDYAMQRTGNDSLNDEICLDYLRETIGYPFKARISDASADFLNTSSTKRYFS